MLFLSPNVKPEKGLYNMSVVKSMRKLQEAFAWAHMKRDVTQFIKQCPTCITHSKVVPRHPMGEMPIATSPGHIVAADPHWPTRQIY